MPRKSRSKIKFEQVPLKQLQKLLPPEEILPEPERPLRSPEKREPYSVRPKSFQK